ncbi:LPS assembly protein LptD [Sulfitobacter sp. D35]|uniref:LPS-assembly protein LptD n=1 Tax=Sulfitobacter sp. D35 TaxID=3083252 RepID=UPI00296EF768|nr:LPS assembly protein LptD [Sulfitobacter sp. D35]MDW4497624.1 LPS assembly protein LptD [Sulfitobacter sp. D35]
MRLPILILLAVLLCLPRDVSAQAASAEAPPEPAVLVADELFITPERVLVARGNVEAFQGTTRIRAQEIRYDQRSGALDITGPITLRDGESVAILASAAELDPELESGLLTSARLVLNRQLQLAAVQINRVDGRYSQLYKTAVTSCKVCEDGRPPLWQIRARRVVHDDLERQIYFEGAQFRIYDLPIFYFPRLRLPDPTVERTTGFLIPSVRTTSQLGTGVKIPYFFTIGPSRDLTLTPYISGKTKTLEFRYREAFRNGRIEFNGAASRDDQLPGETRAYLFGYGSFDLPRDFKLDFAIETTTDDAYLLDYDYSDKDRLKSEIAISRARRDEFVGGSLIKYHSLRDNEDNSTLPTLIGDAVYEARLFPSAVGGELRLGLNLHSHQRSSTQDIVGRDVNRINARAEWLRTWTLSQGLVAEARAGAVADFFDIKQDSTFPDDQSALTPQAALALRYPMSRTEAGGATQFLEPLAQLAWVDDNALDLPNEESTLVEFDEGNLLSLSRFPRPDRRERGVVTALGVNWARFDPRGWQAHLTLGQVLSEESDASFTESSGLRGTSSDYLLAGQIKTDNGWAISARSLFDGGFDFTKSEIRGHFIRPRVRFATSYLWLIEDPDEMRDNDVSEVSFEGEYDVSRNWSVGADWRFDLASDRAATAGVGVVYTNECVTVDLSLKRRYTSSTSVEPSTSFGFTIGLRGFSAQNGTENYSRSCGK